MKTNETKTKRIENLSNMQELAIQIYSVATLLGLGDVFATGDESILDGAASILQEKATILGRMLEDAKTETRDAE